MILGKSRTVSFLEWFWWQFYHQGINTSIIFEVSWDIPANEYRVELWHIDSSDPQFYDLYDEFQDAYNEFREQLRTADYGYLFGYPCYNNLGYNLAKTVGNIALLTLDSNDTLEWCWHCWFFNDLYSSRSSVAIWVFTNCFRCRLGLTLLLKGWILCFLGYA